MSGADNTKILLAQALKQLLHTKPLKKISVRSLMDYCSMNRSTFYYHFQDIQDLINWICRRELIEPVSNILRTKPMTGWDGIMHLTLNAMYENKDFYYQALLFDGQNSLKEFFTEQVCGNWKLMMERYLDEVYSGHSIADDTPYFVARYFGEAASNMVIKWALRGMLEPPERLAARIDAAAIYGVFKGWTPEAIKKEIVFV